MVKNKSIPKHGQKSPITQLSVGIALFSLLFGGILPSTPAKATLQTFSFTGAAQIYVVPEGVSTISVTLNGAQGGSINGGGSGGLGATVQANIAVTPGEVLMVNVGGNGTTNSGWNGGGRGAGHGGGASDIRRHSGGFQTQTSCAYTLSCGFNERLVVAGGGGGGGWAVGVPALANGGDGGEIGGGGASSNLPGGDATSGGGATTTSGTAGSGTFTSAGQGAAAGNLGLGAASAWVAGATGGGGGGGFYGGGSGGVSQDSSPQADGVGGGGGGSSWAGGNGVTSPIFSSGTTQGDGSVTVDPPSAIPNAAFGFSGAEQFFQVPADVDEIAIRLYGAGGGAQGDIVFGRLTVSASSVIQVNVGGRGYGNAADYPGRANGEGGWNGGGSGDYSSGYASGGGGGGATDLRICSTPQTNPCSLSDRVVVAGGGGGGSNGAWGLGGGRGGAGVLGEGGDGSGNGSQGFGATLTAGGAIGGTGAATPGLLGLGGNAGTAFYGTGGGGGGLYGGGGGNGSGGGGGSSCASAAGPCDASSNLLGAQNSSFAHTQGNNGSASDGLAIITAMPKAFTGAISNLTSTGASVSGLVNAKYLASTPKLFLGTNQAAIESCASPASSCTPASTSLAASNSAVVLAGNNTHTVSGSISGLSANTTYYYRVCAQSVVGYACGETETFSTALAIITQELNSASVGFGHSTTLTASGGSGSYVSWALANGTTLPAGLSLNTSSGVISGVPSQASTGSFDVEVSDSSGGASLRTITFQISSPPPQPPPAPPAPASNPAPVPTSVPSPQPQTFSPQVTYSYSVVLTSSASVLVTINGASLSNAVVSVVGVPSTISLVTSSNTSVAFWTPASLANGLYSLTITTEGGVVTLENFLEVRVPVQASRRYVKFSVVNFAPGSAALTRPQMLRIKNILKSVSEPVAMQCVGFTMGPKVLRSDYQLALKRAKTTCGYIKRLVPAILISRQAGSTDKIVGDQIRRVEILIRSEQ